MTRSTIIDNAFLYPATDDWGRGSFLYGVASSDPTDARIDFGAAQNGRSLVDHVGRRKLHGTSPHHIEGQWLYLGPASSHFGHFLSECIWRYWAVSQFRDSVQGAVILPDRNTAVAMGYVSKIMSLLKLQINNIRAVDVFSMVDRLIVPEPGKMLGEGAKPWFVEFLERTSPPERYFDPSLPSKIFVSRRRFKQVGRVAGFDGVADDLARDGYFEFQPELYSIERQMQFICSAKRVVWEEGSAVHLLELLPHANGEHILLMRRSTGSYGEIVRVMREKCASLAVWDDVEFISSRLPSHNRMSRIRNIDAFSQFIYDNTGTFLNRDKFNLHEKVDVMLALAKEGTDPSSVASDIFKSQLKIGGGDPNAGYSIISRNDKAPRRGGSPIHSWFVDTPALGASRGIPYADVGVAGWLVIADRDFENVHDSRIVFRSRHGTVTSRLDRPRPDVIAAILGSAVSAERQKNCGFGGVVPASWGQFDICFEHAGASPLTLCTIEVNFGR
ncbi:MAG: glycosyltransferase family 61 protein [Ferrovibrio sp.]|uniref:glycosyltransferase 61 family protein n=1 Tax=Ferrovibrio sp. TaxID=1917215 RepID=UPI00260C984F|nr:glycosyltransferase family 61 protein [Ferrovibrio sp.]MCW0233208.1 glycosyltransferase family 61 protein [Ferrovibrio sp.]